MTEAILYIKIASLALATTFKTWHRLFGDNLKKFCPAFFCFLLLMCMFSLSGCALLEVPGLLIGGTFKLLGQLINLAGKLPKPPPGVF